MTLSIVHVAKQENNGITSQFFYLFRRSILSRVAGLLSPGTNICSLILRSHIASLESSSQVPWVSRSQNHHIYFVSLNLQHDDFGHAFSCKVSSLTHSLHKDHVPLSEYYICEAEILLWQADGFFFW